MALWRVKQAAEYLGIRPKTLYEWVRLGRVPYRKIGFNVRFDPEELKAWTENQSQGSASADAGASHPASPDSKTLSCLAVEVSAVLRDLEKDVGTSLSFPQRRKLLELAKKLEKATADRDS
jgi:excisionase family DNA binding protein